MDAQSGSSLSRLLAGRSAISFLLLATDPRLPAHVIWLATVVRCAQNAEVPRSSCEKRLICSFAQLQQLDGVLIINFGRTEMRDAVERTSLMV